MITVRVAHGISSHFMIRFKEWVWAIVFLLMGGQLARDEQTFAAAPLVYRILAGYFSEETWARILIVMGAVRIIALSLNGTFGWFRGISPIVRAAVAFLSAGIWFALGTGFYAAFPIGITCFAFWGLMVAEIYNAYVIAGEAGTAYRSGNGVR